MKNIPLVYISIVLLCSCTEVNKKDLPPASGLPGDIYLVMDSAQWKGSLGSVIDSVFHAEMPGLPRTEPIFNMKWIDPLKLNFVLKQRRNLIFIITLDKSSKGINKLKSFFTPNSLAMIEHNPKKYVTTSSNGYAKNQEIMYLYGRTERELIRNIQRNKKNLIDHFNEKEKDRLIRSLYKTGWIKGIDTWLQKNFKCEIRIPFGYRLVENNEEFLWVRQINPKDDKNIFITRSKYTSQDQFKKTNLIKMRDRVCKKYLFEDPDIADSYLITETTIPFIPVTTREINFNDAYTVEIRGLWRANNFSMGGPFVGYAVVDEPEGIFYYIESFVFSPGKSQRELIRELEVILSTFKTSEALRMH